MDAYKVWQPAAEKFDYHIATIAAAVFAWGVQTMTLTGLNVSTGLQGVGLVMLLGSAYFALRRIEGSVQIYRMSLADATNTDRYSKLIEQERMNHAMGEPPDMAKIARYEEGLKAGKAKTREYANTVRGHYTWRNRLLLVGLVVYAAGRAWAQVAAPATPPAITSPIAASAAAAVPAPTTASQSRAMVAPATHGISVQSQGAAGNSAESKK